MSLRNRALLAAFLAALIYGISFTVAKEVMPIYVKPYAFIILRVLGATLLFWIAGIFIKKEKIERQDYLRIFLAAVFGAALNMLMFFKGLSLTTPINASVMMLTTPILVLILSTIILKEKINFIKFSGIIIGLIGAIILLVYGQDISLGSNVLFGNFLIFVNAIAYSLYLIIVKRLTDKYNPLTFVKWIYLFGLLIVIPFGFSEIKEIQWHEMSVNIYYKIGFIVVFTTFFTYLLNLFALTKLKPTTLSIFIYLQPVIAAIYALIVKSDSLNFIQILSTLLIFLGIYLVTQKSKLESNVT
jgi:drug/metabolite transporter (DMT)-like permease